jgi:intracellular septation protein A
MTTENTAPDGDIDWDEDDEAHQVTENPWLKLLLEVGPLMIFLGAYSYGADLAAWAGYPNFGLNEAERALVATGGDGSEAALSKTKIMAATAVFMPTMAIAVAISWFVSRKIPVMPMFSLALVLIFGGLTLWLQNETFFKMKPTILNTFFGIALLAGLAMGKMFLKVIFEEGWSITDKGWRILTIRWALFFFFMAVLNEVIWRNFSSDAWVQFKVWGNFPLTMIFAASQIRIVGQHPLRELTPLKDLRILDLSRVLAGPWIGQTFSDLGADVIKIESPTGDDTRKWGPPWVEGEDDEQLDAAYFHAANRGKRSIVVDFTTEDGQEIIRRLVKSSDVVVENFKKGGLEKYGLDHQSLAKINPKIITCSITGFGQDGPYSHRAGYDYIIQGMSGIMDLTGEPDGDPQRIGVAFSDIFTGLYGVIAIQAALTQRDRTGKGQHIDMSLLDTMTSVLANQAQSYLSTGNSPQRTGNFHSAISPYQSFQCADFPIIVTCGNDGQFRRFVEVLGAPEMADDPRYLTNATRVANRTELNEHLDRLLGALERDALLAKLEEVGVPAGPINTVAQAFDDPHVKHREMVVDLRHKGAKDGKKQYVRTPIRFSDSGLALKRGAPRLGQHTNAILREIGWEVPEAEGNNANGGVKTKSVSD